MALAMDLGEVYHAQNVAMAPPFLWRVPSKLRERLAFVISYS
jgi:hypothetical protein